MAFSAGVVTGGGKFSGALIRWRSLTLPDAGEGSRGVLGGGAMGSDDGGAWVGVTVRW